VQSLYKSLYQEIIKQNQQQAKLLVIVNLVAQNFLTSLDEPGLDKGLDFIVIV
jgi:hypothetical protein